MKLKFEKEKDGTYTIMNKKQDILGHIIFYPRWKDLVWIQDEDIMMSADCLQQIVDFMESNKNE